MKLLLSIFFIIISFLNLSLVIASYYILKTQDLSEKLISVKMIYNLFSKNFDYFLPKIIQNIENTEKLYLKIFLKEFGRKFMLFITSLVLVFNKNTIFLFLSIKEETKILLLLFLNYFIGPTLSCFINFHYEDLKMYLVLFFTIFTLLFTIITYFSIVNLRKNGVSVKYIYKVILSYVIIEFFMAITYLVFIVCGNKEEKNCKFSNNRKFANVLNIFKKNGYENIICHKKLSYYHHRICNFKTKIFIDDEEELREGSLVHMLGHVILGNNLKKYFIILLFFSIRLLTTIYFFFLEINTGKFSLLIFIYFSVLNDVRNVILNIFNYYSEISSDYFAKSYGFDQILIKDLFLSDIKNKNYSLGVKKSFLPNIFINFSKYPSSLDRIKQLLAKKL